MFGFDGEIEGFQKILRRIATNPGEGGITHKEVRAYGRCLLPLVSVMNLGKFESEIKLMLVAISASGLPHYDRSFLASKILKLLEEIPNSKSESTNAEYF
ncbi:hypothetical protein [Nostoc sp. GT001]|uniref:hypothetical protein n=1 Tax=Nostoc sp. GT001 TaxID=3056647 RepID=UPI0025AB0613|nr:hypothetical protein [Nostoc sp. GT001]MDM9583074.1 hypothetical protein [Nostoc sp. GT001]